jgi:hypothetical protein
MYFNGSLSIEGVGTGVLLISPSSEHLRYVLRIYFKASDKAAIHGLQIAIELGIR